MINNKIDYNKLSTQMFRAVANNSGPESVSEMKNVIYTFLLQFSGQINGAVNNLKHTAEEQQVHLNGLSDNDVKQLQILAGKELKRLTTEIDNYFNPKRVNVIVRNAINSHVANATHNSMAQIDQYFDDLSHERAKVDRLATKTNKLSSRLDKANQSLDNVDKKFWYGIATTIIVTACVVWVFL